MQAASSSAAENGRRVFLLPLALTLAFLGLSWLPRVQAQTGLLWAFWGTGGVLLAALALAWIASERSGAIPSVEVSVKKPHWVQALLQTSIYLYWGWYWRPVYDEAVLILAQLLFLYVFDLLLAWLRRKPYRLGFGPLPIIYSTNLFIWFRDDVFFLQFMMVALGALGKECVTWTRDGRRTHIFNPSAFSLSVISWILIATRGSGLTWGEEISNTIAHPVNIYLLIFGCGVVVQYLFGVTLMTLSAASAIVALGLVYQAMTGVYFFLTTDVSAGVFIGLHLLVTDPSTSPRTNLGKVLFGGLYGLSVCLVYLLLSSTGTPTFYDKLLAVPFLNLSVQVLDRFARSVYARRGGDRPAPSGGRRNLLHMSVWALLFVWLLGSNSFGPEHEGRKYGFWHQRCEGGSSRACDGLRELVENDCRRGLPKSCGYLAGLYELGLAVPRDLGEARRLAGRACERGYAPSCEHLRAIEARAGPAP